MLLISFASVGFIVNSLGINVAVALSSALALIATIPLFFIKQPAPSVQVKDTISGHIYGIPRAMRSVQGGFSLLLLAGLSGALTFTAKETISSLNIVYSVDIRTIGIITGLAMISRIIGTILEEKAKITYKTLLLVLILLVSATIVIDVNVLVGIVLILLTSIVAQMLFFRLRYRLSSTAPEKHIAALVSGLSVSAKLASSGIVFMTGIFAGYDLFHVSFIAVAVTLVLSGIFVLPKIDSKRD